METFLYLFAYITPQNRFKCIIIITIIIIGLPVFLCAGWPQVRTETAELCDTAGVFGCLLVCSEGQGLKGLRIYLTRLNRQRGICRLVLLLANLLEEKRNQEPDFFLFFPVFFVFVFFCELTIRLKGYVCLSAIVLGSFDNLSAIVFLIKWFLGNWTRNPAAKCLKMNQVGIWGFS